MAITKEMLQEWMTTIGGGADPIGIEAHETRRAAERVVTQEILSRYWGYGFLGDAIHQLYMDGLREIAKVPAAERSNATLSVFTHWHIVSAERFYGAFDLITRGYFAEGAALSRSLWETAVTLAAVQKNILEPDTMYQVPGVEKPTREQYARHNREMDRKVQAALIWKNPALSADGVQVLQVFFDLMNAATHKGMLALATNHRLMQSTGGVDLFPVFDAKMVEVCFNILYHASWSLLATLRYLSPPVDLSSPWGKRYELALRAFRESAPPSKVGKYFHLVIDAVF